MFDAAGPQEIEESVVARWQGFEDMVAVWLKNVIDVGSPFEGFSTSKWLSDAMKV